MLPFFEAKGGFFAGLGFGLSPILSILACALAGIVITLILLYFYDALLGFLVKTKIFNKLANKIKLRQQKKVQKFNKKNSNKKIIAKLFALCLFVAIPLPLTGFYTGSLIASGLKLNKIASLIAITIGNIIALLILAFPFLFV